MAAAARLRRDRRNPLKNPRQARASQIGHAERLSPRSGNVCSEKSGMMCVCRSRARERCSSWSSEITFNTTSRSKSAGSAARYVLPDAPWPSSAKSRNGPKVSPGLGKSETRVSGRNMRSQPNKTSSSSFQCGNRLTTSVVAISSPDSRRRHTSS